MKIFPQIFFLLLLLLPACTAGSKQQEQPPLNFPTPPESLTTPESRASYIMEEVWTPYNVIDTSLFTSGDELEQFFVNYFAIGDIAGKESFRNSISELFHRATEPVTIEVKRIADVYLNHPNSPIYKMDNYVLVMDEAKSQGLLEEVELARYSDEWLLWSKNRVGHLSEDFGFITRAGKRMRLHETPVQEHLALLFYDPSCGACTSIFAYIEYSSAIQDALKSGALAFLAIDPRSAEEDWRKSLDKVPPVVQVGLDSEYEILHNSLYDLRPMPTIYLLDAEYKVVAKDIQIETLEQWLRGEVTL